MFNRAFLDRTISRTRTMLDSPVLIFIAVATTSTIWFGGENQSIKRLIALSLFVVAFFATTNFVSNSKERLCFLTKWLGIGGGLAGLTGIISLFYYPFRSEAGRSAGAFGNPNAFANFLLIAIPFTFAYLFKEKKFFYKLLWGAGIGMGFLGLFSAKSRGAFMALVSYPLAAATVIPRKSAFFLIIIVAILVSGHLQLFFSGYQSSYFLQLLSYVINTSDLYQRDKHYLANEIRTQESYSQVHWSSLHQFDDLPNSLGARMMIWGQALETFRKNPIFGIGLGRGMFSGVPYDCKTFNNAFCNPLTIATEMGLLGLVFYLMIIYKSAQHLWEGYKLAVTHEQELCIAAMLAGFASFHIHSVIEDFIFAIMCNWMYGILTGLIAVAPVVFAESNKNLEA